MRRRRDRRRPRRPGDVARAVARRRAARRARARRPGRRDVGEPLRQPGAAHRQASLRAARPGVSASARRAFRPAGTFSRISTSYADEFRLPVETRRRGRQPAPRDGAWIARTTTGGEIARPRRRRRHGHRLEPDTCRRFRGRAALSRPCPPQRRVPAAGRVSQGGASWSSARAIRPAKSPWSSRTPARGDARRSDAARVVVPREIAGHSDSVLQRRAGRAAQSGCSKRLWRRWVGRVSALVRGPAVLPLRPPTGCAERAADRIPPRRRDARGSDSA